MLEWAAKLGPLLASAVTRDEEEFVTELRHVPEGWIAVGAIALVAMLCWLVAWMYRTEGRRGASPRVRTLLAILRCAVVVTLAVILLEPVRVRILRRWVDSYTVLLVDASSSMDLTDRYRDAATASRVNRAMNRTESEPTRRIDLVQRLLGADNRAFLRGLADNNRVVFYTFGDEPSLRATIQATRETPGEVPGDAKAADAPVGVDRVSLDLPATGSATNIERALRRAVDSLGSAPVAGVIFLSDGGFNQGASAEDTARFARDRRLPLYVVGVGDPSDPQNVRVTEVVAPPNAFQRDPFSITARLASEGIDGQTLEVRLRERDASGGGEGRVVETRQATVGPGGAIPPIGFERRQSRVGRFVYEVEVPMFDGESVADDNARQTTVNVIDSRTRVLIVAGGPSWDYRFVSRLLERDQTFDVSCWLQSADLAAVRDGTTVIDHLPVTAEELYAYDVVVLLDPDREELDENWCRLVDTLVTDYGGGLLYGAARMRTPELMRDRTLKPLVDLLPVTLDPESDIVLNEIGHYQLSPSPMEIADTAFGHPVMQIAGDSTGSKLAWQGMDDIYWHFPVLREKPAATVLMRDADPKMRNSYGGHVLAAVQYVGAGRTGFLAFDGSWRWRRKDSKVFDQFWVRLLRYLAEGKLLGGTKRGTLLTESDEFSLGAAVTVSARLLDAQYKPLTRDQVTARFEVEGERGDVVLSAQAERPGWFEGRFVPDRTGSFRLSLLMPDATAREPVEITKEIRVSRPNIEILRPQMDRAGLMALAEQSHGGRYFEVDEASQLPGLIPDLHEEIPIRSRPTTLWDNWKMLAFLMTLLGVEWGVRKWNRLL